MELPAFWSNKRTIDSFDWSEDPRESVVSSTAMDDFKECNVDSLMNEPPPRYYEEALQSNWGVLVVSSLDAVRPWCMSQ